jgi:hypothetical protein
MVFKQNWEKTGSHTFIADSTILELVKHALPGQTLIEHEIISGGCININIKITIAGSANQLIMRIYLRDPDCVYNEQAIAKLLHGIMPVPTVYSIHDFAGYRYAIVECMQGITMRELLLNMPEEDAAGVVYETGKLLAAMQNIQFEHAGFFDKNFSIKKATEQYDYIAFLEQSLAHPTVQLVFSSEARNAVQTFVLEHKSLLPGNAEHTLVHGDYDPANILVGKNNGTWHITAVLDWEFAFSGSWLWDVSNMLRYAHEVPAWYETSFLQGLEDAGLQLPDGWRTSIKILTLLSLLDILMRNPADSRPCKQNDIVAIINHIIGSIA